MSDGMMKTDPGGESTQYESIDTVNQPHSKEGGQMGDQSTRDALQSQERSGDNAPGEVDIPESGSETTNNSGEGSQDSGFGDTKAQTEEVDAKGSRESQGYGPGSGVGA
ncbi:MAG: hypothetical protein FRX48_01915 [Lasallia pustulata]|uniref:Uncharacterized protein n=1 Tax=Lasallia pustulata TaxID=136370 RepID=A0A1W5CYI6_9LECA|nr:MAG: hypothetical protein FRX48_01915 [Lasallia pustulata]SLM35891.1 hypothetical protein LPUS_05275 [Lasallia pustulata]